MPPSVAPPEELLLEELLLEDAPLDEPLLDDDPEPDEDAPLDEAAASAPDITPDDPLPEDVPPLDEELLDEPGCTAPLPLPDDDEDDDGAPPLFPPLLLEACADASGPPLPGPVESEGPAVPQAMTSPAAGATEAKRIRRIAGETKFAVILDLRTLGAHGATRGSRQGGKLRRW